MLTLATWLRTEVRQQKTCWLLHVSEFFSFSFYFHPRRNDCWRPRLLPSCYSVNPEPWLSSSKVGLNLPLGATLMLNVVLYFLLASFVDERNLWSEILNNYHYHPNPIWPQNLSFFHLNPKNKSQTFVKINKLHDQQRETLRLAWLRMDWQLMGGA